MADDRRYRSDARTLRALAIGDLHLDLPGWNNADHFDEALIAQAGARAARQLGAVPAWSRAEAARRLAAQVAAALGLDDVARWSPAERRGITFLAPLIAGLPGIADWSRADRAALAAILRSKGAAQERDFALASRNAVRFFHSLRTALQQGL
jgi:hypothetical protein